MKTFTALVILTLLLGRTTLAGPLFDGLSPEKQSLIRALIADHFPDSTLSPEEQAEELAWFVHAASGLQNGEISILSEQLPTHDYEADVLAPAFSQLTGIAVTHDRKPEGEVIRQINLQRIMAAKGRYDAFVNDSDMIGTHARGGWALALSDYMEGEGKAFTLPSLALHRCLVLHARRWRQGHSQRAARGRMGHSHGRVPSGRIIGQSWWRHQ